MSADHDGEFTRFLVDSYGEWAKKEGVPIVTGFSADLRAIEVAPWERFGTNGAIVHLAGRGKYLDLWLLELERGGRSAPQRHLCEAVVYVISGRGSTRIHTAHGPLDFEWGPKSLFAIPLNAQYELFNASGVEPARLSMTTTMPVVMNLFHSTDLVFGTVMDFPERLGKSDFEGRGRMVTGRRGTLERNNLWETSFVPDLELFANLKPLEFRGKASKSVAFLLADGSTHAHMSEIPVGRYKKAHRHPAGFHIHPVTGRGYSLLWYEGDEEFKRVDWCHGVVYAPPDVMYHQHFNLSPEPSRYLAVALGSHRYPFSMEEWRGASNEETINRKDQIEPEFEDPRIRKLYLEELTGTGVEPAADR